MFKQFAATLAFVAAEGGQQGGAVARERVQLLLLGLAAVAQPGATASGRLVL